NKTMILAKHHDSDSTRLKMAWNNQVVIPEFWLTAHVNWFFALRPHSGDPPAPPVRPASIADANLWLDGVRITNIHPFGGGGFLSFELVTLSAEKVRTQVIHEYQWIRAGL